MIYVIISIATEVIQDLALACVSGLNGICFLLISLQHIVVVGFSIKLSVCIINILSVYIINLFVWHYQSWVLLINKMSVRGGHLVPNHIVLVTITQFLLIESILLINLDNTFQKQFCASFTNQVLFSFYNKNSMSYNGFDLKKCLKMKEFYVFKKIYIYFHQ